MANDTDFNNALPLFCTQVIDKISAKNVFINFKSSGDIKAPENVPPDEDLILAKPKSKFNLPLRLSPLYYTKDGKDDYVMIALINDIFAIRRVLHSEIMRIQLVMIALDEIEKKYNSPESVKLTGQFIGHKIEFERRSIKTLSQEQCKEKITKFVNNKITLLQERSRESDKVDHNEDSLYDLHFRPTSRLLTCSLHTEKLPDSIAFNEDRIVIKQGADKLVDVHLSFFVDLKEPMKYKFDDRLGLFRAVFKIIEPL